jgi:L-threonylcarbamoyladenylate synthase
LKTQTFQLQSQADETTAAALHTLSQGGIMLFPTESVYGLGVDSQKAEAIERLYDLKGRPKEKPFQWLVHDVSVVKENSGLWNETIERITKKFWPGPLTFVLSAKNGEWIGWRIPKNEWLLQLLKKLNRPLIATSANPSGQPTPNEFQKALIPFEDKIELAVDGGLPGLGTASTVVQWDSDQLKILREGAIAKEELQDL